METKSTETKSTETKSTETKLKFGPSARKFDNSPKLCYNKYMNWNTTNILERVASVAIGDNAEKAANYILWADAATLGPTQCAATYGLPYRFSSSTKTESYEALLESPTFNEAIIYPGANAPRVKRTVFSRQRCRELAPAELLPHFEELWQLIDETDLTIVYYELAHNKREKPPREELTNAIAASRREQLRHRAESLTQQQYLGLRHMLVELRKDQYSLRDLYEQTIGPGAAPTWSEGTTLELECEIDVRPLGMVPEDEDYAACADYAARAVNAARADYAARSVNASAEVDVHTQTFGSVEGVSSDGRNPISFANAIWTRNPNPFNFDDAALRRLSKLLWRERNANTYYIDFTDPNHILALITNLDDLEELPQLNATFNFYESISDLTDIQRDILHLKKHHKSNEIIADVINAKYNKTYNVNYISTIYRQHIIPAIAAAASRHFEVVSNLFFPENFKKCTKCGEVLLVDGVNFMKKAKSRDGYAPRCKKCNKEDRDAKK